MMAAVMKNNCSCGNVTLNDRKINTICNVVTCITRKRHEGWMWYLNAWWIIIHKDTLWIIRLGNRIRLTTTIRVELNPCQAFAVVIIVSVQLRMDRFLVIMIENMILTMSRYFLFEKNRSITNINVYIRYGLNFSKIQYLDIVKINIFNHYGIHPHVTHSHTHEIFCVERQRQITLDVSMASMIYHNNNKWL